MVKTKEEIFIQIGEEVIQLKGSELDAFLKQREEDNLEREKIETELQIQKQLKIDAYKKLGLTDEEIQAIL